MKTFINWKCALNLSSQKSCLYIYMQQPCCKPTWSHDVTDWTRVIQIHSQMDTLWVSLAVEVMKTSLGTVFPLIVSAEAGFWWLIKWINYSGVVQAQMSRMSVNFQQQHLSWNEPKLLNSWKVYLKFRRIVNSTWICIAMPGKMKIKYSAVRMKLNKAHFMY